MQKLTLVPMTQEQNDTHPSTVIRVGRPFAEEVSILRGALRLANDVLNSENGKHHITVLGGTISRLSDSIVRATLAELRLARSHDEISEVRAEIKRVFEALGWGE